MTQTQIKNSIKRVNKTLDLMVQKYSEGSQYITPPEMNMLFELKGHLEGRLTRRATKNETNEVPRKAETK